MTKLELKSSLHRPKKEEAIRINSTSYTTSTGCMQVELEYFWSGHLGTAKPVSGESSFETAYKYPGTKEINLVVISPSGVIDRNIDIVDVN